MQLLVTKPEKAQLIHPPIMIIGSTLVRLPFIMSVTILGSETNKEYQLLEIISRSIIILIILCNYYYNPSTLSNGCLGCCDNTFRMEGTFYIHTSHGVFRHNLSLDFLEKARFCVVEVLLSHSE